MTPIIVIVDSDAEFRKDLRTALEEKFKVDIQEFRGCKECILALQRGLNPAVIITNQTPASPKKPISGSDLCRAVSGLFGPLALPTILVTVEDDVPLMPAYQAGASDVLLKPIQPMSRLLSKIHMTLTQRAKSKIPPPLPRNLNSQSFNVASKLRTIVDEGGWIFAGKVILSELGRGGIGVVAKALDLTTGELSAVKILQPEHVNDVEWYSRFRREGKVLTGVSHPNLVTNNAIGVESGINYIDMDFVVGTPLNEMIEEGSLSENQAFDIAAQIARGLEVLDKYSVVHRDIKPENIMVTETGHAWLIDFGLSKQIGDQQLTQEGEILGTIAFIAPETISGEEPDIMADIYALGVTVYEMLTAKDLLGSKSTRDLFIETLRGKTVKRATRDLSPKASAIISRMMAVSRSDRYNTPTELLKDLEASYPEAFARHKVRN